MQLLKKYISIFLLVALLTPMAIQVMHAFENHDHISCTSTTNQHLHELENDCDDLHLQLKVFTYDLKSNINVDPQHFHTTTFTEQAQQVSNTFFSKKSSRAPPVYTV